MKKLYCILIVAFIATHLHAQWTDNRTKNLLVADISSADIQIANTSDGKTWIAFYSQRGNSYDMRAQLLDVDGNKLLGDSGLLVSDFFTGSATFVFNVCVDIDDNFIIAAQAAKGNNYECGMQKISTAGRLLWKKGIDLGPGLSPYPVALTNNDVAVAWNNDNKISYQVVSADGIAAWSPYKSFAGVNNAGVSRAQLVAGKAAKFSMVYQQTVAFPFYTNLYAQQFNKNGIAVWSNPVKISTLTTASYRYYDVLSIGDTVYVGYYGNPSNKNRFDAYVQKINPDGSLPWLVNGSLFADYNSDNDFYEQTIYINKRKGADNIWAVCTFSNSLQTTSGVYAQSFDAATGNKLSGNKALRVLPVNDKLSSLAYSHLTLCGNQPLFLTTNNTNMIRAVKVKNIGTTDFQIVAASSNSKFRYGFTDVINGQAVAVWQEDKGTGDKPYAQNVLCVDDAIAEAKQPFTNKIVIENIRPNPVTDKMTVSIQSLVATNIQLYITDVNGNIKQEVKQSLIKGSNVITIDASRLMRGSYFLKAISTDNSNAALLFQKN